MESRRGSVDERTKYFARKAHDLRVCARQRFRDVGAEADCPRHIAADDVHNLLCEGEGFSPFQPPIPSSQVQSNAPTA